MSIWEPNQTWSKPTTADEFLARYAIVLFHRLIGPRLLPGRPTTTYVAPLVRDFMAIHCEGASLHCVLSDGNIDGAMKWYIDEAIDDGDLDAAWIALLFFAMSKTQRFYCINWRRS